jgi:hypothetical protein
MRTADLRQLVGRDRAVLRAVAADQCTIADSDRNALALDGLCFCDQFAGTRLVDAGFVTCAASQMQLTDAGQPIFAAAA